MCSHAKNIIFYENCIQVVTVNKVKNYLLSTITICTIREIIRKKSLKCFHLFYICSTNPYHFSFLQNLNFLSWCIFFFIKIIFSVTDFFSPPSKDEYPIIIICFLYFKIFLFHINKHDVNYMRNECEDRRFFISKLLTRFKCHNYRIQTGKISIS